MTQENRKKIILLVLFAAVWLVVLGGYYFFIREDATPPDTGVADPQLTTGRPDGQCKIGYWANHADINSNKNNGYLSLARIEDAAAIAELESLEIRDLRRKELTNSDLADLDILFIDDDNQGHQVDPVNGGLKNKDISINNINIIKQNWYKRLNVHIVGESSRFIDADQNNQLVGDLANGVAGVAAEQITNGVVQYPRNSVLSEGWIEDISEIVSNPGFPSYLNNALFENLTPTPGIITINQTINSQYENAAQCYRPTDLYDVRYDLLPNEVPDLTKPLNRITCMLIHIPVNSYASIANAQNGIDPKGVGFLTVDGVASPTRSKITDIILDNSDCYLPPELQDPYIEKFEVLEQRIVGPNEAEIRMSVNVYNPNSESITVDVRDTLPVNTTVKAGTITANGVEVPNSDPVVIEWLDQTLPPATPVRGSILTPSRTNYQYTMIVPSSEYIEEGETTTVINNAEVCFEIDGVESCDETDVPVEVTFVDPIIIKDVDTPVVLYNEATANYSITVQNSEDVDITTDIVDTLPAGITPIDGTISDGGVYNATNRTITWTGITVPAESQGGEKILTYSASFPASSYGQDLENIAVLYIDGEEIDQDNAIVTATRQPVIIDKAGPDGPNENGTIIDINSSEAQIRYSIDVTNPNNFEVTDVEVTDVLPNGTTNAYDISSGGVYSGNQIFWDNLTIPAGDTLTLTYTITLSSAGFGNAVNTATVCVSGQDCSPDEVDTPVDVNIQVEIDKRVPEGNRTELADGSTQIKYEIETYNLSDTDIVNYSVEDDLDEKVQDGWVSQISDGGVLSNGTIIWSDVDIPANSSVIFTYVVTIPDGVTGTFDNFAVVKDENGDPEDEDEEREIVVEEPDVETEEEPPTTTTTTGTSTTGSTTVSTNGDLPETSITDNNLLVMLWSVMFLIGGYLVYRTKFGENLVHNTIGGTLSTITRTFLPFDKGVELRAETRRAREDDDGESV